MLFLPLHNRQGDPQRRGLMSAEFEILTTSDNTVRLSGDAKKLIRASMADETRRAYISRLNRMSEWFIDTYGNFTLPLSVERYIEYITMLVKHGYSTSYIVQLNYAVSLLHREHKAFDPTTTTLAKRALKGAVRTLGKSVCKKDPVTVDVLERVVSQIDRTTLSGKRDAAMLLFCFTGAFRRSELVALDFDCVRPVNTEAGLPAFEVRLKRSKTDQEGKGFYKAIFSETAKRDLCPVEAFNDYVAELKRLGITEGAIFRRIYKGGHSVGGRLCDDQVACILQRRAKKAGVWNLNLGAHSLRSGFVTTAIRKGMSERSISHQTGHKSPLIMRGYYIREDVFEDNAAKKILS